jgi:uncharacterized cupredoxin-like copper-binding protein
MSWKGSGDFRAGSKPPSKPAPASTSAPVSAGRGPSSIWDAGGAGGPSLMALIIAACVVGLVGLGLAAAFGGTLGTAATPSAPAAAQPTAAPAVAPTAAPAAAQPTAASAAAPAAGGAAAIPTEPLGPALATGTGEALSEGSNGEQLAFENTSLTVPNGLVTLTFKNNSSAVQHNWVLVDGGDDVATTVDAAATKASSAARNPAAAVPPADTPGLLVATQQLNPGEEVTVTFETPGPGTYTFLCTFPGHYLAGMKGTLTVE